MDYPICFLNFLKFMLPKLDISRWTYLNPSLSKGIVLIRKHYCRIKIRMVASHDIRLMKHRKKKTCKTSRKAELECASFEVTICKYSTVNTTPRELLFKHCIKKLFSGSNSKYKNYADFVITTTCYVA